jgi:hypothetical protein
MELPYALGAKRDRPDPRDYLFKPPLSVVLNATAVDRKFYTMVNPDFRINQGNEGTCVGHGDTNLLMAGASEHKTYPDFQTEELAHQFARRLYVEASGDLTYKKGMQPRDACAKLLEWELIDSYWTVPQVDDVITALLTYGPVGLTLPWYFSMYDNQASMSKVYGNWWIKVNMDSDLAGYHWVAATGVDLDPDDGAPPWIRIENSWGSGWGYNGTGRLTVENFRRLNTWGNWTFAEKPF